MKTHGLRLSSTDCPHLVLRTINYIHSNTKGQHKVQELLIQSQQTKYFPCIQTTFMCEATQKHGSHLLQSFKYLILLFLPTMTCTVRLQKYHLLTPVLQQTNIPPTHISSCIQAENFISSQQT